MKRFFLKVVLLIFPVVSFILLTFFCIPPQYSDDYCASLIDKVDRLKSITEPKIVLLGNSNLAFGINSEIIENEIGMPIVNMGLHGGLSDPFHERMAFFNIKQGDIYVYCYHTFGKPDKFDPGLAWITVENNFDLYKLFTVENIPSLISALPRYSIKKINRFLWDKPDVLEDDKPLSSYLQASFNKYGDVVQKNFPSPQKFGHPWVSGIAEDTVKRINSLNKAIAKQGATFLVAGCPIGYEVLDDDDLARIEKFTEEVSKKLDCPVISDYKDYLFEADYFYDTTLHLTHEGAKLRTEQLVRDILNWQKNSQRE